MLQYRIKIGPLYVADPEIVGLDQHWTGTVADALTVSARTALEILTTTMAHPDFARSSYTVEPIESNLAL